MIQSEFMSSKEGPDLVSKSVRKFYDSYGWIKNEDGIYNDTKNYGLRKTIFIEYETKTWLREKPIFSQGGKYFLDAASGSIPHWEYLELSKAFTYRICVDFSIIALKEAKSKINKIGFCVCADITKLPFKEDTFQAILSAYTIQHIAETEQLTALKELCRVLKIGYPLLIFHDTGFTSFLWNYIRNIQTLYRELNKIITKCLSLRIKDRESIVAENNLPLYSFSYCARWYYNKLIQLGSECELKCHRIIPMQIVELLPDNGIGNIILKIIAIWENRVPHAIVPFSKYITLIAKKPKK